MWERAAPTITGRSLITWRLAPPPQTGDPRKTWNSSQHRYFPCPTTIFTNSAGIPRNESGTNRKEVHNLGRKFLQIHASLLSFIVLFIPGSPSLIRVLFSHSEDLLELMTPLGMSLLHDRCSTSQQTRSSTPRRNCFRAHCILRGDSLSRKSICSRVSIEPLLTFFTELRKKSLNYLPSAFKKLSLCSGMLHFSVAETKLICLCRKCWRKAMIAGRQGVPASLSTSPGSVMKRSSVP